MFALQKAALPAAAAIGGLAVVIGDATKAAMKDAKAQELLAQAIEKNTLAGEANVRAAEAYIEATMMSAAVADDQLRPALATLVQTTGDLTYSQELLNTALDISAATGTDLQSVTDAVAKAYAGNTKALGNLVPSVRGLIKDGASLDTVMQALNATVGGAATVAANSVLRMPSASVEKRANSGHTSSTWSRKQWPVPSSSIVSRLSSSALMHLRRANGCLAGTAATKGSSLETIKYMVASGMGVTVLPRLSVPRAGIDHVKTIAFEPPAPSRHVVLAWRRSFTRYEAIAALRNAVMACSLEGVTRLT